MIPDSTTAALGILLTITILTTVGRIDRRETTENPSCHGHGRYALTRSAAAPAPAHRRQDATRKPR